jgi:hypothetical protein
MAKHGRVKKVGKRSIHDIGVLKGTEIWAHHLDLPPGTVFGFTTIDGRVTMVSRPPNEERWSVVETTEDK